MAVLQYYISYNVLRLKSKLKIIFMTFRSRSLPHFGAYSEGYGYGGSLPRHHRPHSSLAEYRGGVADPTSRRSHSSLGEYRQPQSSRYVMSNENQVPSTEYRGGVADPTSRRYLGEYRQPQSSRYVPSTANRVPSTERVLRGRHSSLGDPNHPGRCCRGWNGVSWAGIGSKGKVVAASSEVPQ